MEHCRIPATLPITVAAHGDGGLAWEPDAAARASRPAPDKWPLLKLLCGRPTIETAAAAAALGRFPTFPEAHRFGSSGSNRRPGMGCHHPKLLLLRRRDCLRVVVTSANLTASQWLNVTNTVWWQDFPRQPAPDSPGLLAVGGFGAELAALLAALLGDWPAEAACWAVGLASFDFGGAAGALVVSVPGLHPPPVPPLDTAAAAAAAHDEPGRKKRRRRERAAAAAAEWRTVLGAVVTTVAGVRHGFKPEVDPTGARLRALAVAAAAAAASAAGGSCRAGLEELAVRRVQGLPADSNAIALELDSPCAAVIARVAKVSPESSNCSRSGGAAELRIGYLPRAIAAWAAPLWDAGLVHFAARASLRQVLAAAAGRAEAHSPQLCIYILEGPRFASAHEELVTRHARAFAGLLRSLQRPLGLWRLHQASTLGARPQQLLTLTSICHVDHLRARIPLSTVGAMVQVMQWAATTGIWLLPCFGLSMPLSSSPPHSDIILAAAAVADIAGAEVPQVAAGARDRLSVRLILSGLVGRPALLGGWGHWTAELEARSPSLGIVFPTIDHVNDAMGGPSEFSGLSFFTEALGEWLLTANLLHDAIPEPPERSAVHMHVKVALRRFRGSAAGQPASGWVYCGSHNLSPAAWGRPVPKAPQSQSFNAGPERVALGSCLHIYNYEAGIVLIEPPAPLPIDTGGQRCAQVGHGHLCSSSSRGLDRIVLPFQVPAPQYQPGARPASWPAVRRAIANQIAMMKARDAELCSQKAVHNDAASLAEPEELEGSSEVDDGGESIQVTVATAATVEVSLDEDGYAERLWTSVQEDGGRQTSESNTTDCSCTP
eukprot:SM000022S07241  [mRNA]  locus=s22:779760:783977:- [translate_table: standard]